MIIHSFFEYIPNQSSESLLSSQYKDNVIHVSFLTSTSSRHVTSGSNFTIQTFVAHRHSFIGESDLSAISSLGLQMVPRWWFQIFFIFTRKIGEMIQFDLRIFFKGVGSTTKQVRLPITWAAFADALAPLDQKIYASHDPKKDTVIAAWGDFREDEILYPEVV